METLTSPRVSSVIIPFSFSYVPLKKLALINFEKNPDSKYLALEPQYFDGEGYGKAYRVIAYRHDGYVDVYDDMNLEDSKDDASFDVVGKGLCERKKVVIDNARFEKVDGRIIISFQFTDKYGREIVTKFSEHTSKKSNGVNLLAPVGSSTQDPSYLALFFLYNFDFVRKYKTKVEVTIDGKSFTPDNFPYPLPKDFQWRYYTRYSEDCQIIEFANAKNCILGEYTLDESNKVEEDSLEYQFNECGYLKKISLKGSKHPCVVEFDGGFPDVRTVSNLSEYKDKFKVKPSETMGFVSGDYSVKREGNLVKIELIPSGGWSAEPTTLFTKMMFAEKSLFRNWPKTYKYTQTINVTTLESTSQWERIK